MTPVWIIEWMQTTPTAANPSEAVLQVGWRCNGTSNKSVAMYCSNCAYMCPYTAA